MNNEIEKMCGMSVQHVEETKFQKHCKVLIDSCVNNLELLNVLENRISPILYTDMVVASENKKSIENSCKGESDLSTLVSDVLCRLDLINVKLNELINRCDI